MFEDKTVITFESFEQIENVSEFADNILFDNLSLAEQTVKLKEIMQPQKEVQDGEQ